VETQKQQFADDQRQCNTVVEKIRLGNRRFCWALIRVKLAFTQGSTIPLHVFIMNLENLL
jgi:hypothetical protein